MKYMFVKLPQPCGCVFASKQWDLTGKVIILQENQIYPESLRPDTRSKIIWVYVNPECKQVEHAVEYP